MIFRKTSKGGIIFNQQIYVADFGPIYSFFDVFRKKWLHNFLKTRGGREGQRPSCWPDLSLIMCRLEALSVAMCAEYDKRPSAFTLERQSQSMGALGRTDYVCSILFAVQD